MDSFFFSLPKIVRTIDLDKNIETMKTNPRQWLVLKLFASVTTSPFPIVPRYGFRSKSNLTSVLKDFTYSSFPEQNPISLVVDVLIADFVFAYKNILQQLKPLLCKDFVSKV